MHRKREVRLNIWKLYDHKTEKKYDYNIWKLQDHKAEKYDVLTNDNMKRSLKDRIYHRRLKLLTRRYNIKTFETKKYGGKENNSYKQANDDPTTDMSSELFQ